MYTTLQKNEKHRDNALAYCVTSTPLFQVRRFPNFPFASLRLVVEYGRGELYALCWRSQVLNWGANRIARTMIGLRVKLFVAFVRFANQKKIKRRT
jgi:hypothetical protein